MILAMTATPLAWSITTMVLTLSGTGSGSFASALVLLGIGWNFLYVGGTTLLTTTYTTAERGRAQAINDMTIFAVGLSGSLSVAALLHEFGWQNLNLLLLPWLALAALSILWLFQRTRPLSSPPTPGRPTHEAAQRVSSGG